jgi:hypothetical protein
MPTPSVAQIATTSNWITSSEFYSLVKPQNDPKLVKAFGSQDITGLMDLLGGGKNPMPGILWRHWEEDRLMTIVNATGTTAAAGVAVVYTLTSPYEITGFPSAFDPYNAASFGSQAPNATGTTTLNPMRVGQDVSLGNNAVKGTVIAVTSTTFTVAPDSATVLPTLVGTEPIVLNGIVNGEGGGQPLPLNFRLNLYTGVAEILTETAGSTGTALAEETWVAFEGDNGVKGNVFFYKNQLDARKRIMNAREVDVVSGQAITSTGDIATYDATMLKTSGLFTFAQSYNGTNAYNIANGISLDDWYDLVIDSIDKNKGSDENSVWASIRLRKSIDAFVRPEMQAGGILYNAFGGESLDAMAQKQQYVNFGFGGFAVAGKTFHLKTYDLLNNPTSLGALPMYQNMGVVIPLDSSTERIGDLKEKIEVPALRMNYVSQGQYSREMEEWLLGGTAGIYNTQYDFKTVNFRTHFSFEGFRPNAYAFLQGL